MSGLAIVPPVLFHATYREHLDSILQWGLGGAPEPVAKNYEDSQVGVVYLATSADVALSYAETSDAVPEDWLEDIVVLQVDASRLDASKLFADRNVLRECEEGEEREGAPETIEFRGVIPVSALALVG